MNCYLHPDAAGTAFCNFCGRPLCVVCQRRANNTVFCPEHAPTTAGTASSTASGGANPYVASSATPNGAQLPVVVETSPGLAFLLGLIPGVGAIYNGQYVKGLLHALIFGLLISLADSADGTAGEPFLAILATVFYFYMPFEAYHTARKRRYGLPLDEWSSIISQQHFSGRAPAFPIVLISIGLIFLLDSLHIVPFREIGRFWPLLLIAAGVLMLNSRLSIRVDKRPPSEKNGGSAWGSTPRPDIATETSSHEQ